MRNVAHFNGNYNSYFENLHLNFTVNNDLPKFRDLVSNGTKVKFLGCLDVNVYQHMVNLYKLGFIYKKL